MPDLVELMQAHYRKLVLDFELTFSAGQISHAGERGRLLEEGLRDFLTATLPSRIGVGSGQVVAAPAGNPSKQVDVVLHDDLNFPLLLRKGSYQLFPNETVLAVIEVKSRLNARSLRESVENIASCTTISKFPAGTHPDTLGIVFAYDTEWKKPETLFKNLCRAARLNNGYVPDLLCSLDPGFLLAATGPLGESVTRLGTIVAGAEKKNLYPRGEYVLVRPLDFSREHVLLWFYLLLIDYLNRTLRIGVNMAQYTSSSTAWSPEVVSYTELMEKCE